MKCIHEHMTWEGQHIGHYLHFENGLTLCVHTGGSLNPELQERQVMEVMEAFNNPAPEDSLTAFREEKYPDAQKSKTQRCLAEAGCNSNF